MTHERSDERQLAGLMLAKLAVQQVIHDHDAPWQLREKARLAAVQAQNLIDAAKKRR